MNTPIPVNADSDRALFAEWSSNFVGGQMELNEITNRFQNLRSSARAINSIAAAIVLSSQANAVPLSEAGHQSYSIQIITDAIKLNSSQVARIDFDPIQFGVIEKANADTAEKEELETIFNGLAKKWRDETRWSSMTMRRYAHPSYQAILVLGGKEPREVTKLILRQMQKNPDMWFEALRRLNNQKDDPAKNAKTFEEATDSWLAWGIKEGLIS